MKNKDKDNKFLGEDDFLEDENHDGENPEDKTSDDDWEYFDDCPICQAMEDGRADTLEGLTEAFREAKRQGHDVYFAGDEEDWDDIDNSSGTTLEEWLKKID